MRRLLGAVLAGVLLAAGALTACGTTDNTAAARPAPAPTFAGFPLDVPVPRPHAQLVDDSGKPYDLWARTHGEVTLLYVGYTHCPDLCPLIMATVARALDRLPASDRDRIATVFVTADPARDTPAQLHGWLARFSPDIRGLTGTRAELTRVYTDLGMPAPALEQADNPDSIEHAASLYVFGRDDVARLAYDATTTVGGLAGDLREVLAGERPPATDDSTLAATGGTGRLGLLRVVGAFLDVAPDGTAQLTMTAGSDGDTGDALEQVSGPDGVRGQLRSGGRSVDAVTIPALDKGPITLHGPSAVVLDLPAAAARESAVDLRLTFRHAGSMLIRVPIRPTG